MTDSIIIARGLDYATSAMQWIEGKEHVLAMAKVLLCSLITGGT